MKITKAILEQKLANLQAQKEQAVGQVNIFTGAILLTQELLADLAKKPSKKKKKK